MLGTFVAGRYSGTLNAVDIGITEDGYHLRWKFEKDPVNKTDAYGSTLIESFYQGANVWCGGVFKEFKAGVIAAVSPYNTWANVGAVNFDLGIIGRADTGIATALVLSATAGTPAAVNPATLTAQVVQDDSAQVEQNFGPTHRKTPFLFRLYPTNPSGVIIRFFSTT
jgi:hypothetical protein